MFLQIDVKIVICGFSYEIENAVYECLFNFAGNKL